MPYKYIVYILALLLSGISLCIANTNLHSVNLYDVYEIKLKTKHKVNNPFDVLDINLEALFISPTGKKYTSFGFYDGKVNQTYIWKIRFNPDIPGRWKFKLKSNKSYFKLYNGDFLVSKKTANPLTHGHIKVDPNNSRALIHLDGTPHYWIGGKWISARDYGLPKKSGIYNKGIDPSNVHFGYKSNETFIKYLNLLTQYKHNGILLKTALYPLEKDNLSWDLKWIHRAEWLIKECIKRGINVQVNIFDTWSRDKDTVFKNNTMGSMQPFNVWKDGDDYLKENYIKNLISRMASYPNVYWELGNEMEHKPNSGDGFIKLSNKKYIPWIRKYDPYNLPIGLSEGIWKRVNVDIGFLHQTDKMPDPTMLRPVIMNELVSYTLKPTFFQKIKRKLFGKQWHHGLWHDSAINNPELRFAYRKTFWNVFTNGGAGASEATWLDIDKSFSKALHNVMQDHMHLKTILDKNINIVNHTYYLDNFIYGAKVKNTTRGLRGKYYITYFQAGNKIHERRNIINIKLQAGKFKLSWLNPKTGEIVQSNTVVSVNKNLIKIAQPAYTEDIVLISERIQ